MSLRQKCLQSSSVFTCGQMAKQEYILMYYILIVRMHNKSELHACHVHICVQWSLLCVMDPPTKGQPL